MERTRALDLEQSAFKSQRYLPFWPWLVKWEAIPQWNWLNGCSCWHCSRHWGWTGKQGGQNLCLQRACHIIAYLKLLLRKAIWKTRGRVPNLSHLQHNLAVTSQQVDGSRTNHIKMLSGLPEHIYTCLRVYIEQAFLGKDNLHTETLLQWSWRGPISGLGKQRLDSASSIPLWLDTLWKHTQSPHGSAWHIVSTQ